MPTMFRNSRSRLLRASRKNFLAIVLAALCFLVILRLSIHGSGVIARDRRLELTREFEQPEDGRDGGNHTHTNIMSPSVHLVVASTAAEDISWAYKLNVPNLQVIHYVADDPTALHHPPANRGHEAMIYHSYFHDFYDHLPDIAILTHAQDVSWHMEPLLSHSVSFAVSNLDLLEVEKRGYSNLRVSWENACPDWINTTISDRNSLKLEERYTRDAFLANFGSTSESQVEVPEILAQPCCSQFAVTKENIRSIPREQYGHFIHWLETAAMNDAILGRTWEHMFQWLFAKKAVDCPVEWKAYCSMYHICFDSRMEYEEYMVLDSSRAELIDMLDVGIARTAWHWMIGLRTEDLEEEIGVLSQRINALKRAALIRGADEGNRKISKETLYLDEHS
jgi:hypothetical protein